MKKRPLIVFPEAEDERVLKAADIARKKGICEPLLIGKIAKIEKTAKKVKVDLDKYEVFEPVEDPLLFSAQALKKGKVDAMIAGAIYTSAAVVITAIKEVGVKKGVKTASSFFVMDFGKKRLIFADAGVVPDPTPEQLAEIAITTGESAKKLGFDPRIALLSFSTRGSASPKIPAVKKVLDALKICKRKSRLKIDGEFQLDTALIPDIARRKVKGKSQVAGKANVLIFPDLNSGNIGYKITERLAGAKAYGPILQGFKKPISDLSRGATVEDIVGVIKIISKMAE